MTRHMWSVCHEFGETSCIIVFWVLFLFTTSPLMSLVDVYMMFFVFSFFLITFSILFSTLSRRVRVGVLQISIIVIISPLQDIWTVHL